MLNYGLFCEKYGRVQDSIKIYQRMFENFYFNSEYKNEINESINRCLLEFTDMKFAAYRDNLENT